MAKSKIIEDIHDNLKIPVTELANRFDLQQGLTDSQAQLGSGQLWRAFKRLADNPNVTLHPAQNRWPEPVRFFRSQLEALLPEVNSSVIREVLRCLSSSPVLEGIATHENQFLFANNLLPAWLQYSKK